MAGGDPSPGNAQIEGASVGTSRRDPRGPSAQGDGIDPYEGEPRAASERTIAFEHDEEDGRLLNRAGLRVGNFVERLVHGTHR